MNTVALLDGRQVDSASEAWRHECEARYIAALPSLAERRIYLTEVERRRGKAEADRLRATMKALWKAKKQ
jgi:5-enolpyruvylshikimate-3-phosphate synthase